MEYSSFGPTESLLHAWFGSGLAPLQSPDGQRVAFLAEQIGQDMANRSMTTTGAAVLQRQPSRLSCQLLLPIFEAHMHTSTRAVHKDLQEAIYPKCTLVLHLLSNVSQREISVREMKNVTSSLAVASSAVSRGVPASLAVQIMGNHVLPTGVTT